MKQHDPKPTVGEILVSEMTHAELSNVISQIEDRDNFSCQNPEVLVAETGPLRDLGHIGDLPQDDDCVDAGATSAETNMSTFKCCLDFIDNFRKQDPKLQGICMFLIGTTCLLLHSVIEPLLKCFTMYMFEALLQHCTTIIMVAAACAVYVQKCPGGSSPRRVKSHPQAENVLELMSDINDSPEALAQKEVTLRQNADYENALVKYGAATYTDEEVRELLNNLRSPRPFIHAKLDNTITELALLDSGASVNLISVAVVDEAERKKQRSYSLYRSTAVVSGVGAAAPPVHGVIILPVVLGKVDIGPVPFLVVDKVTETTRVLLGCKTLCKLNLSMQFRPDNTICTSMDIHGQRSNMPIELLSAEVYNVYLCEDSMIPPGQSRDLKLTTDKSAPPNFEKYSTLMQFIPHVPVEKHLDVCSLSQFDGSGDIAVRIRNKSTDPVSYCKHTEMGLCSVVNEEAPEILALNYSNNKNLALSNEVLTTCPCSLPRKLFFCSPDGSTGLEPKYSLLSPYSSRPPMAGLQMLEGNIYVVPERRGSNYHNITPEIVRQFCKAHKIATTEYLFAVYNHPASVNAHTSRVLAFFIPVCKLGIRKAAKHPTRTCIECTSFNFNAFLEPKISYPFRDVHIYILGSAKCLAERLTHVCDSEEFRLNIHATNFHVFRSDERQINIVVHLNPGISKKVEYLKYLLMSLFRQIKPLFPLAKMTFMSNTLGESYMGNCIDTALRSAIGASKSMPDYFDMQLKRAPRMDKIIKKVKDLNLEKCTCLYCTSNQENKLTCVFFSMKMWPSVLDISANPMHADVPHKAPNEVLAGDIAKPMSAQGNAKPPIWHETEASGLRKAIDLTRAPLMDLLGTFIDHNPHKGSPEYGLINKDTPAPEEWEKFYDFSQYSPLEKFYVKKLFERFASTTLSFFDSDSAIIRDKIIKLRVKPGAKLPKCRSIPLRGEKLEAAHKICRDMETKGIAVVSHHPRAISPGFLVYRNSMDRAKALRGEPFSYRLVVNYQQVSAVIETADDSSIAFFNNVNDSISLMSRSRYKSALDHRSAFLACRLDEESQELLAFIVHMAPIMQPVSLALGLCNTPSLYSSMLSHVLAGHLAQTPRDPNEIISRLINRTKTKEPPLRPSPLLCDTAQPSRVESLQSHLVLHADDINVGIENAADMTQEEELKKHVAVLYTLLEACEKAAILISVKKMKLLYRGAVTILGYQVSSDKIEIPTDRKELLGKMIKTPTSFAELQSALGSYLFVSSYICDYSRVAACLYALLKKDVKFDWTEECQKSFDYLKNAVLNAPSLFLLSPQHEIYLVVDASCDGYCGVLFQVLDGEAHILRYTAGMFRRKFIQNSTSAILELAGITLSLLANSYLISCAKNCKTRRYAQPHLPSFLRP